MTEEQEKALGHLICDRTPYKEKPMRFPDKWQDEIDWDEQTGPWNFRGVNRQVARALRIPVIITHEGAEYRDWLIIGYEGSAGP